MKGMENTEHVFIRDQVSVSRRNPGEGNSKLSAINEDSTSQYPEGIPVKGMENTELVFIRDPVSVSRRNPGEGNSIDGLFALIYIGLSIPKESR